MDQWKTTTNDFSQSVTADVAPSTSTHTLPPSNSIPDHRFLSFVLQIYNSCNFQLFA